MHPHQISSVQVFEHVTHAIGDSKGQVSFELLMKALGKIPTQPASVDYYTFQGFKMKRQNTTFTKVL